MDIFIKQAGEIQTLELIDFKTGKNIANKFLSRWFGINSISTLVKHDDEENNGRRYDCVGSPSKGDRVMHDDDFQMYREILQDEQSNIQMQKLLHDTMPKADYTRVMRKIDDSFNRRMRINENAIFCMLAAIEEKEKNLITAVDDNT